MVEINKNYKRYCNFCKKYYEGVCAKYCSRTCQYTALIGRLSPKKGVKQKTLSDGSYYPKILSLCLCGCNEIVYNGNKFIRGHQTRIIENRIKNSQSHKGKKHNINTIIKMRIQRAKRPPPVQKGTKFTAEHKANIRSKKIGVNPWQYFKDINATIKKMSGKNSHMWKGGIAFLPYCHKFNNNLKESVRERDGYTCQLCGIIQNGRKHSIHHIHYDKENCYPDLITLCNSCNGRVNRNRQHFESLFMNNLNERHLLFWAKNYEHSNRF